MPDFVLAPKAASDITDILEWSEENLGVSTRARYEALIVQAIQDVADDPERPGSHSCGSGERALRIYHLEHSRKRLPKEDRVRHPRHFLLYCRNDAGVIEVSRVLHDSMDLPRYYP